MIIYATCGDFAILGISEFSSFLDSIFEFIEHINIFDEGI